MFTRRLWNSQGTEDVLQTTFKMYKQFSNVQLLPTTVGTEIFCQEMTVYIKVSRKKNHKSVQDRLTLSRVIKFACRFLQITVYENKIKH